jgi:hypothetical protein
MEYLEAFMGRTDAGGDVAGMTVGQDFHGVSRAAGPG